MLFWCLFLGLVTVWVDCHYDSTPLTLPRRAMITLDHIEACFHVEVTMHAVHIYSRDS